MRGSPPLRRSRSTRIQLDAALEAGQISADTLVCAPGTFEFVRLGVIAGLDEAASAPSTNAAADEWPPPPVVPVLSEAQKRALAAKDRKAEASKAKRASASGAKRSFAASKSAPFSKGGDRHAPPNGAI